MRVLGELCQCGSGQASTDCCGNTNPVVDLTQYKFDQAERELRLKLVDFSHRPEIQAQIGEAFYVWKNDPEFLGEYLSEEDVGDLTFARFFDWFIHDFKLLDSEKRVIERFYDEEGQRLSEIEKSIIADWLGSFFSFFEVVEVFPKQGCRIRDIFTKEAVRVQDASSSKKIFRSDIVGARPVKTGNYVYFSGVITAYPQAFKTLILDFFNREFREYKKAFGSKHDLKGYLKDWGFVIGHYVEDVIKNPRFLTPDGDELVLASAEYGIKNYKAALKKLREMTSIEEMEGGTDELRLFAFVGGRNGPSATVEMEKQRLRIACYSIGTLRRAKSLIEKKLSNLIVYEGDSLKKLDSHKDSSSFAKKTRKARSGLKSRGKHDAVFDEYYEEWLEKPLEVLDGKTPREASQSKKGREKLDSILDDLDDIYKYAREGGEPYYDVVKLRKKLGLESL